MSKSLLHNNNHGASTRKNNFHDLLEHNINQKRKESLSDEKFDSLWNLATLKHKKIRKMSWTYSISAALIALMISLAIIKTMVHTEKEMKQQYQQATLALYKVSHYMNRNIDKLSPIEEMMETTQYFDQIEKPLYELQKIKHVRKIPLKH